MEAEFTPRESANAANRGFGPQSRPFGAPRHTAEFPPSAVRDHAEPMERTERMLAARRRAGHVLTVPLALLNQQTPKKDVRR